MGVALTIYLCGVQLNATTLTETRYGFSSQLDDSGEDIL